MQFSRSFGIAVSGTLLVLAAIYFMAQGGSGDGQSARHAAHDAIAAPRPAVAAQPGALPASLPAVAQSGQIIRIAVAPNSEAAPGVYRFRKNDRVEFHVTVPYDGMLAVHGYASDVAITANQELTLPLKLEHTGRFPMHVHVSDGRHIEVAALEIFPD